MVSAPKGEQDTTKMGRRCVGDDALWWEPRALPDRHRQLQGWAFQVDRYVKNSLSYEKVPFRSSANYVIAPYYHVCGAHKRPISCIDLDFKHVYRIQPSFLFFSKTHTDPKGGSDLLLTNDRAKPTSTRPR